MSDITYPYKPALVWGIIFLILAAVFVWIGELGIVIAIVCVAAAVGCISAAYTTAGHEKITWDEKNFWCRIFGCKFVYRMNHGSGQSYGATCSRCGEHL